ncbi:MAG TPA: hypothetical protein VGV37_15760 [Aliidongia sp.]|uniref:hypothetical protein n=1 Tax=Aliidongia sp. TaxID=1914230 RepID=UPI002DDD1D22|nr:hypothetical protein [Aliidongia sp.]HEV2675978.1 hypothetical protein [Aliidongia sp.]
MIKLLIYALLAYIAFHFVRRFLVGLGVAPAATPRPKRPADAGPAEASRLDAQDLVQCTVCGHYVAARCTRTNCPQ